MKKYFVSYMVHSADMFRPYHEVIEEHPIKWAKRGKLISEAEGKKRVAILFYKELNDEELLEIL